MSKSSNPLLAGMLLLILVPVASSFAAAPAAGNEAAAVATPGSLDSHPAADGAYASEVPDRDIVEHKDGTLAADNEAGTIPVAQELDFVRDNSFRKPYDESLKSVAKVEYYGTRYVGCEQYSLEIHAARPNQVSTLIKSIPKEKLTGLVDATMPAGNLSTRHSTPRLTSSTSGWSTGRTAASSPGWATTLRTGIASRSPVRAA